MKLFKVILLFLVLSGVALFALGSFMDYFDNTQSKACRKLKPGITEADIVAALGPRLPESKEENIGYRTVYFRPDILASGPIVARVDKKTKEVTKLRCSYDGATTWEVGNQ